MMDDDERGSDSAPAAVKRKISNRYYLEFLTSGSMRIINQEDLQAALDCITGRYSDQGKALLISLYYTGARPNEILRLRARQIQKRGSYLVYELPASKRGLARECLVPTSRPFAKVVMAYAARQMPEVYLFSHYWSKLRRIRNYKRRDGTTRQVVYWDITNNLHYYIKKWFAKVWQGGIPPYYLRHSRFSKLVQAGVDEQNIRILKGAKTMSSVYPYLHMSRKRHMQIARKME